MSSGTEKSLPLDKILAFCAEQEQQAIVFYENLKTMSRDPAARQKYAELIAMERKHLENLQNFKLEKYLDLPPVDLHLTDYLVEPEIKSDLTTQEILILAAKREQRSAQMYRDLAEHFKDQPELGTFFQLMADEELRHKHSLESEYEEGVLPEG